MNTDLPALSSSRYKYLKQKKWNNASIIAASLYSPDMKQFQRIYTCSKATTAGEFLDALKLAAEEHEKMDAITRTICQKKSSF